MQQQITPSLWFDTEAEDAARLYTSIFEGSKIVSVSRYTEGSPRPAGMVMAVEFELNGQRFIALNGGPEFKFNEAISFLITCETQEEIDRYWERLTADGGEEGPCGWCKDRYGVSWQVVPSGLAEMLSNPDPDSAKRATQAMMQMRKIDLAALREAADGVPTS